MMMPSPTPLTGRWHGVARTAWLAIFALYLGLSLIALPAYWARINANPSEWVGWAEVDLLAALAQLPVSRTLYLALFTASDLLSALLSFVIGFFIFRRKSDEVMPLLVSFLFISLPAGGGFINVLFKSLTAWQTLWRVVAGFSGNSVILFMILLFYLFPDGQFVPRWTRWAAALWAGLGLVRFLPGFGPSSLVGILVTLSLSITLLIAPVYRYARISGPLQRKQTQSMVLNLGIGAIALLAVQSLGLIFPSLKAPGPVGLVYALISYAAWPIFLLFLPLSFAIAIVRSRLFEIDVIIRRTLIYSVLSGLLAFVYFGLIIILQGFFTTVTGQSSSVATVLSTLAIAALFLPLRRRVQNFIDKRFYRQKYDAQKVIADFAATCRDETDLDQLTSRLVEVVQETMQPESVTLWLKDSHARPLRSNE